MKFLSGHVYQIPELPWKPIQSIQHCNSGTNCARAKPLVPIGSLYPTSYSLVILFDRYLKPLLRNTDMTTYGHIEAYAAIY